VPTGGDKGELMRRTHRARIGCLAVALALPASFAGCGGTTQTGSGESTTTTAAAPVNKGETVSITGSGSRFAFEPTAVTVKVGNIINWKNDSGSKHTVKTDSGQGVDFSSDTLAAGDTFQKTIDKPGTYTYFCSIHSKDVMSGTIVVTA